MRGGKARAFRGRGSRGFYALCRVAETVEVFVVGKKRHCTGMLAGE
jgi:hypothetical protein